MKLVGPLVVHQSVVEEAVSGQDGGAQEEERERESG